MTTLRTVISAWIIAAVSSGCASSPHVPPRGTTKAVVSPLSMFSLDAASSARAKQALTSVERKYASCRVYRGGGTVIEVGARHGVGGATVNRFDTLFVRDRGLRFRYFQEDGHPQVIVWSMDGDVRVWSYGHAIRSSKTLQDNMYALRGVTSRASWIVSRLLFGESLLTSPTCGTWYEETLPSDCRECPNVAIACSPEGDPVVILSLDLRSDTLKRYYRVQEGRRAGGDPLAVTLGEPRARGPVTRVETVIVYDSFECNEDEPGAMDALRKQPW